MEKRGSSSGEPRPTEAEERPLRRLRPQPPETEANTAEQLSAPTVPLWTLLTGQAYRFAREVQAAFPDATRVDWTGLLQWALARPDSSSFAHEEKRRILLELNEMFVRSCREFALLLIDESLVPAALRTVQPEPTTNSNSVWKHFRQHSEGTVLFKLAEDVQLDNGDWMCGGHARDDRLARKIAGHELKSARALFEAGVSVLRYPMLAAFTRRGKRVLCTSCLPAAGNCSLVQGKDHNGSVKKPPPNVERVMHYVAAGLGIAKSGKSGGEVVGPTDMGIYNVGGFLYMTDAARLLPPEYRKGVDPAQRQLYQLLRPELLRKATKRLVPDALRYKDEGARRDLEEVSCLLDEEMAALARELTQGQSSDRIRSRSAVKALLHSRGLNMRHLREVIVLLDERSPVRVQLQSVLDWRRSFDEVDVKTVPHLVRMSELDIRKCLELQKELLEEGGGDRVLVLPSLLRLADAVGDSVPLEWQKMPEFSNSFRPWGKHPLVEAWELCVKRDRLDLQYRSRQRTTSCSQETMWVMYEILRHGDPCIAHAANETSYPNKYDLSRLVANAPKNAVVLRIKRFIEYAGVEDEIKGLLLSAARDGEWSVARDVAQQHGRMFDALLVAAEWGGVDLIEGEIRRVGCSRAQLVDIMGAACRGGRLQVVQLLLDRGVAVNDLLPNGASFLMRASAFGSVALVEELLNRGADINCARASDNCTALMAACQDGWTEVVSFLLSQGANVNAAQHDGFTSLLWSSQNGRPHFRF
jgi:hypothetical protein